MTINFDGISDVLVQTLVGDLGLANREREELSSMTASSSPGDTKRIVLLNAHSARQTLTQFAQRHPEAERSVSRLILKHLGISRSVFRSLGLGGDGCSQEEGGDRYAGHGITQPTTDVQTSGNKGVSPLAPKRRWPPGRGAATDEEDDIPPLSPIPWLSQSSWSHMTLSERVELMEHAIRGLAHPSAAFRSRNYPQSSLFRQSFVMFGRGGVDRVILGHGPRHVLIVVGIHGNEACGVEAARLLLQRHQLFVPRREGGGGSLLLATDDELGDDELWSVPIERLFDRLTIEFIVGNPRAVEADKRFIARNLNRLLDVHVLCDDSEDNEKDKTAYELQRARILMEEIRHSDAVLDIHSCSSESDPFALPASSDISEQLAECLPVRYVVQSLANNTAEGGTTMDCALLHDVPAVCVECGQHHHPDIVARSADVISAFLLSQYNSGDDVGNRNGLMSEEERLKEDSPVVMRCEGIEIVRAGFEYVDTFREFQFLPFGLPVFRDDERGEVCCPIEPGAFLVMPTKIPVLGEEALVWARQL